MKKKIIALFLACVMCISILSISAFAGVTNLPSNMSHFINDLYEDFQAYRNGNISLTDFLDLYAKNCLKWGYNNVSDVSHIKDVLHGLQNLGVDVPEAWLKYYYEYNDIEKDDSELAGYGAILKSYGEYNGKKYVASIYYGQKGELYNYHSNKDGGVQYVQFSLPYEKAVYYDRFSGETRVDNNANIISATYYYENPSWAMLGNWVPRNGTGTTDGIVSDLPDKPAPSFDDMSDDDLIDFLDKLLEDLRLSYPDLSTLEGLLNAILAKLDTLDSDDDGQLLAEINTAIITLASDNHADNQAIIALLTELKESMKKGTSADLSNVEDKLSKIQKSLDYLCTINTIDTGVDLWKQLTETEKAFLSEYAALITTLLPKFGLTTINNVIMNINSVLLNNTPPSDLTADVFGERVTILSSDMFDGEAMQYIDLAKTFISVLLIYSFCLILRRKIAGGGN